MFSIIFYYYYSLFFTVLSPSPSPCLQEDIPTCHPHPTWPTHSLRPHVSWGLGVEKTFFYSAIFSRFEEFFSLLLFFFFETLCLGSPGSSGIQKISQCLNWDICCRSLSSAGVKGLHHLAFLTCPDMTTLETSAWGLRRLFFSCRVDDFPRCATHYRFSVLFMVVFLNGRYWSLSASPSICFLQSCHDCLIHLETFVKCIHVDHRVLWKYNIWSFVNILCL